MNIVLLLSMVCIFLMINLCGSDHEPFIRNRYRLSDDEDPIFGFTYHKGGLLFPRHTTYQPTNANWGSRWDKGINMTGWTLSSIANEIILPENAKKDIKQSLKQIEIDLVEIENSHKAHKKSLKYLELEIEKISKELQEINSIFNEVPAGIDFLLAKLNIINVYHGKK